jgi:hypothetical protein
MHQAWAIVGKKKSRSHRQLMAAQRGHVKNNSIDFK